MKKVITIGMAGAGRACELHMLALKRINGVNVRYKSIFSRSMERANNAKNLYGFEHSTCDFNDLIKDEEIDVIDICTPPYVHSEMIIKAIKANKHVICEKPLTAYFGKKSDIEPIGTNVSKVKMYEELIEDINNLKKVIINSTKKFMYAENFLYAPTIVKAAELIKNKKSRILYAKGEESLKGSSSPVANSWSKTGGGTFIRTGTHPLSAILWLKRIEAETLNKKIDLETVTGVMGTVTKTLSPYEHRHIEANPIDVEDSGTVILGFSDGSLANIIATDNLLGGSKNRIELYCNDSVINCNLTMSDAMETYFLDEDGLENVDISEMLPSKLGWNKPFISDDILRGYVDEMQDFMESILYNREPISDFNIAFDTAKVVYAAYKSSELKKTIKF